MNLKHFYYRGYFNGIKLSQPAKKSDERKGNDEKNEKEFRKKNKRLTQTRHVSPFAMPTEMHAYGVNEIRLRVQNPGLLPGIGYPHEVGYPGEFKLGFGFDHVTGLPALPGSSVKGVLRSVFPQLKFDLQNPRTFDKPDAKQRQKAKFIFGLLERLGVENLALYKPKVQEFIHALELSVFCGWETNGFFLPDKKIARRPMAKHDIFMDALPVQFQEDQLLGRDALTPHGADPLKNPIPLPFVKVVPGVVFGFCFKLTDSVIGDTIITARQKQRLFTEILCTVGAGAKTNVGYGQFEAENADDRIPPPPRSAAATAPKVRDTSVQSPDTSTPEQRTKPTKLLPFNKSLHGKPITAEVTGASGANIRFRTSEIEGFEGELEIKVQALQIARFVIGKRFLLEITEVQVEKRKLVAKVANYAPLN